MELSLNSYTYMFQLINPTLECSSVIKQGSHSSSAVSPTPVVSYFVPYKHIDFISGIHVVSPPST